MRSVCQFLLTGIIIKFQMVEMEAESIVFTPAAGKNCSMAESKRRARQSLPEAKREDCL